MKANDKRIALPVVRHEKSWNLIPRSCGVSALFGDISSRFAPLRAVP